TAHEARNRLATVDVSARDGVADLVCVLGNWWLKVCLGCAGRTRGVMPGHILCALEAAPTIVAAPLDAAHFDDVALPGVANPELPGLAIEAPAPGLAKTQGVDFGTVLRAAAVPSAERSARGERIVGRDPIERRAGGAADVDANDLPQQR